MVELGVLEAAVRVIVAKEIEEAGRRVGARLAKAFGELARTSNDSIVVNHDVKSQTGAVNIRIAWDKQVELFEENLISDAGDIAWENESIMAHEDDPDFVRYGPDGTPIYKSKGSFVPQRDDETEALANTLAADQDKEDDFTVDPIVEYDPCADPTEHHEELQLDPDDIEFIDDGEPEKHIDTV